MKPTFHFCHIQILKKATDKATLIIMHDITFTYNTSVNLYNSVYEFCMALKVSCIACLIAKPMFQIYHIQILKNATDKATLNPLTTGRVHWTRSKILSCIILIITCPRQAVLNDFVEYSCCNIYISLG